MIWIPLLLIVFVIVVALTARRRQRLEAELARDVLLQLAPRLALPERLDPGPSLRFDRLGFPAAIRIHPKTSLNVEISFRLAGDEIGWITVSSLGFKRAILEQVGFKDLQVGDAEFDERLEVWSSDPAELRKRLLPAIRNLLLQIDRRWDFFWRLSPDQLVLRTRISPLERHQVETLAGIAFQILDLIGLASPNDFVLAKVQEKLGDDTRCPVCGTPLSKGSIVRCAQCRAAHHADCWQFNGLCATFACGSQVHVR